MAEYYFVTSMKHPVFDATTVYPDIESATLDYGKTDKRMKKGMYKLDETAMAICLIGGERENAYVVIEEYVHDHGYNWIIQKTERSIEDAELQVTNDKYNNSKWKVYTQKEFERAMAAKFEYKRRAYRGYIYNNNIG